MVIYRVIIFCTKKCNSYSIVSLLHALLFSGLSLLKFLSIDQDVNFNLHYKISQICLIVEFQ